jgi:RNA methyltransferase, TrmH family
VDPASRHEHLTSPRNPRVVAAAALREARERRLRGEHLAEGRRVVGEALCAASVAEVLATIEHQDLLARAERLGVRTAVVDERVMRRISDATTPPGVVAVVRTPDLAAPIPTAGSLVLLDGLGDPGNVGTLIRSAAAFGLPVVVTGDGADPFGPKAVRAAAGACYRTVVLRRVDLAAAETELRSGGRSLLALAADGTLDVATLRPEDPRVLVLGSEPSGLAMSVRARCDDAVRIPMRPGVESLNVAVAGAIAMQRLLVMVDVTDDAGAAGPGALSGAD